MWFISYLTVFDCSVSSIVASCENLDDLSTADVFSKLQILFPRMVTMSKDTKSFVSDCVLTCVGQSELASEILPGLFLGSFYNALDLERLVANNVNAVVNMTAAWYDVLANRNFISLFLFSRINP